MSRTAYSGSLYWAVLSLPFTCVAQVADTVTGYAAACYEKIGVLDADVEGAFSLFPGGRATSRGCYYGTKLTTQQNGIKLDPANPDRRLIFVPGKKNFLKTCDAPAWLPSGAGFSESQCYDASYIATLSFTNTNVKGALLCRHKTDDPALNPDGSPKHDDFDDIAMILHNKKTGNTCWFQTQSGAKKDGMVPVPHRDTANFWLKPSETANIQCARCHDNGPWMNSQWLYDQHPAFEDTKNGKYETPVYGTAFRNWPKTDDFVTVGKSGIKGPFQACTSCHKLSAKIIWPDPPGPDRNNGTYDDWFDYTTGQKQPPQAIGTSYVYTHWMPTGDRPAAAEYKKAYETHLQELKICMETSRFVRPVFSANCRTLGTPMLNPALPGGTAAGALASATVLQTGRNYAVTATPLGTAPPPVPEVAPVGSTLRLGWQADATFDACTIEATTPPGVLVSATTAAGTSLIGSGANWQLRETPPLVGPLTEPGIYDFSIYCRDRYTGSLQFQVGTAPATCISPTPGIIGYERRHRPEWSR